MKLQIPTNDSILYVSIKYRVMAQEDIKMKNINSPEELFNIGALILEIEDYLLI